MALIRDRGPRCATLNEIVPIRPPPVDATANTPPVYQIDLSLPPAMRYVQVVDRHFNRIQQLRRVFEGILECVPLPNSILYFVTRALLHRVYSKEQTEEIKGISAVSKLPMYLIIAYNVFLDLLMGCTSGGVRVQPSDRSRARMMHFRALDWEMPGLRNLLVQFEYVARPGEPVIARTVSYVGFVGVLTGVRDGLSASINCRAYHNDDGSFIANVKYRFQQLAVVLGFKPSIASIMRDFIIPRTAPGQDQSENRSSQVEAKPRYSEADISTLLPSIRSSAAYLIFCTPSETFALEKDRKTANILSSSTFIAVTNHDISYEDQSPHLAHASKGRLGMTMQDINKNSIDRKRCLVVKWEKWRERQSYNSRKGRARADGVPLEVLKAWMMEAPTCGYLTHFVCVMDPKKGEFKWIREIEVGEVQVEEIESVCPVCHGPGGPRYM